MDPVYKIIQETILTESEKSRLAKLQFKLLPDYAKFILDTRLKDFAIAQLRLARELKIPLLKFFESYSEEMLIQNGMQSAESLLRAMSENKAGEYIVQSALDWVSGQVQMISPDQVMPEDIILISYSRRTTFRDFLIYYSRDLEFGLLVAKEMDLFTIELDTLCFKILIQLQQRLYKQAQTIANLGNWEWDLIKNTLKWSDEMYRIYELDPNSGSYDNVASLNHPEDADMVIAQMKKSRETHSPHDLYYRICLKNGKIKFLHAKGEVIIDEKGEAVKMFGTLQDVTQQKTIERELQEEQYFIAKIAELTPSILSTYNINTGRYRYINEALKPLLGYDPGEVLVRGTEFFAEIIHPEDLSTVMAKNMEAIQAANQIVLPVEHEAIMEFTYRMRHKNGEWRWFHTYGTIFSRNRKNEVEEVLNISVDITNQVEAANLLRLKNEELSKSEERYHKMVEEVQDYAILLLSPEGIIENWNKGAEKLKGYKAEEIIGSNFRIFYTPENQAEKLPEMLIETARTEGRAIHEGWRVRKDGTRFWGYIVITALHNSAGETIGFSKVTRDLTERKLADEKMKENAIRLQEKNEMLEQMNQELESFNYVAGHDLKEPLRKIKLFTDRIIQKNELMSDEVKDYFARIVSASHRMEELIHSVLQYSKAGYENRTLIKTDLNLLLQQVKTDLMETIQEKKAEIHSDVLPSLYVEPMQFRQLFTNLISNGIKYSQQGIPPIIKISAGMSSLPDTDEKENNTLYHRVTFTDNGIGFKQSYAEKIFGLFQRLHPRHEFEGTGIGLAICRKIMQNHDGFIKAKSEPGKGAEFTLFLPTGKA